MKRYFSYAFAALMLALGVIPVAAEEKKGTAAEAAAMVERAIAHIRRVGREKAFADFNARKAAFTDRDLFVVVYDLKGEVLAHGANTRMVGTQQIDLRDNDGRYVVRERVEMMSAGPGARGWQDYAFMNPVTRLIEPKAMYLRRCGDFMVGCSIHVG
jgi:cytochrome c